MSKVIGKVDIDGETFTIYESLDIGETIYAGDKEYTVDTVEKLMALKEGKSPEEKPVKKRGRPSSTQSRTQEPTSPSS